MNSDQDRFSHRFATTTRLYQTADDLRKMLDMLMQARARTNDWRYWHVGELAFSFFMVACHLDPCEHIRLWHAVDGGLAGFAILGEDPSCDCQVLPEYEWCGIERAAFEWVDSCLAEKRETSAQEWRSHLVAWSRQDDARRIDFLEQQGFRYRGEFAEVNMLRSLDEPIPEPTLPDGYQVRALAGEAEIEEHAATQREVWQPWPVGNISAEDYALFMRLPCYQRELDVVTVSPQGVIAAYVTGWVDTINKIGDFGPVGARPAFRRRGLTRAALLESLKRMKAQGMERVSVSTGVSNEAARNLYESVGFRIVNRYLDYVKIEAQAG
ncbi:MAG: hypothetical protein A2Z16_07005 [Chloroflexi bacterium RBG_16_54_18]|nr:MAG: hypothetical protein A2Z16_07005 [Chloroflexi bacterium RBG_16_54_18]